MVVGECGVGIKSLCNLHRIESFVTYLCQHAPTMHGADKIHRLYFVAVQCIIHMVRPG